MDLELTEEQTWLSESLTTQLEREWTGAATAHAAGPAERDRLWSALVDFGLFSEDLGAIELCLSARAFGAHLAASPFLGSAVLGYATGRPGGERVSVAWLEPGGAWSPSGVRTSARPVDGRKLAVELAAEADCFAVACSADGAPALAVVRADDAGVAIEPQPSFDASLPMHAVSFSGADAETVADGDVLARLAAIGALLAAAESVGAAGRLLDDARAYAAERRQFGRTIGSNQALRHLLISRHGNPDQLGHSATMPTISAWALA